jgi:alcohol dehydrogenase
MNTGNFTFLCRTKTGFGMNALEHLPFDLSAMGSQKPLVLLDKEAHLEGGVKPLTRAFKESGMTLGVCPPIDGNPDTNTQGHTGQDLKILKEFYQIYIDNGFDAIIGLGTGKVADMAKSLNIAVTLGPDALKTIKDATRITQPLSPFVYIPTGMGTGMETNGSARFNTHTFNSPFLAPDLAIIDPAILTQDTSDTLINAGLTCLATCCETHVLSKNPPARAYCTTGIGLIMENFLPLLKTILVPGEGAQGKKPSKKPSKKSDKKAATRHLARLTHASVITGILTANCPPLLSMQLGKLVADHSTATPGQAMAILVPAVLDLMAPDRSDLGNLALPLSGSDMFSAVPASQRPGLALQKIQALLNELYRISLGTLPRTLEDAGLDREAISALAQRQFSDSDSPGAGLQEIDPKQAEAILARALDGRTQNQA